MSAVHRDFKGFVIPLSAEKLVADTSNGEGSVAVVELDDIVE
jgi:hypothetical protein